MWPKVALISGVLGAAAFLAMMILGKSRQGAGTAPPVDPPARGGDLGLIGTTLVDERLPRVHQGIPVASEVGEPTRKAGATVEVVEQ